MMLTGIVIRGKKIARTFGVETANINVTRSSEIAEGVYIVECFVNSQNRLIEGILHYGNRKTTDNIFSVEVHLFNFSQDIYDEELEVHILKKIRDTQKFSSLDDLFFQIKQDIIISQKFFLRKKIRNIWDNVDQKSREILANKAYEIVSKEKDFLTAKHVFIYAPKSDEINFVRQVCKKFPDKKYFFPKIINGEMKFFRGIYNTLTKGKWGILEPETSEETLPQENDLIIVPAVGADKTGYRIGNGGGFYDKFLKENPAKKICILPDFVVFDEIPREKHDIQLKNIIIV